MSVFFAVDEFNAPLLPLVAAPALLDGTGDGPHEDDAVPGRLDALWRIAAVGRVRVCGPEGRAPENAALAGWILIAILVVAVLPPRWNCGAARNRFAFTCFTWRRVRRALISGWYCVVNYLEWRGVAGSAAARGSAGPQWHRAVPLVGGRPVRKRHLRQLLLFITS